MPADWYSLIRSLKFNSMITYTQATIDSRYASEFGDQVRENGPYHGKVVDLPDDPPHTQFSRVGVRHDGFHGMTPIYYVRLQDIDFIGDVGVEQILQEYANRHIAMQDRNAVVNIYNSMRTAHAQEAALPRLGTEGLERVLMEMIGPLRSYGELRVQEERQDRDERIEKWLKDHRFEVQRGYKLNQEITYMVSLGSNYGMGSTLERAIFNWIERQIKKIDL